MPLPLTFLLGLAVLMLQDTVWPALPGSGSVVRLLICVPLLLIPALATLRLHRHLVDELRAQRIPSGTSVVLFRVLPFTVPIAYAALVFFAGLPDLAVTHAGGSHVSLLAAVVAPLFLLELSLRIAESRRQAVLERVGFALLTPQGMQRLPSTAFLLLPLLLIAAGMDLAFVDRDVEMFLTGTSLGLLVGFLALVAVLAFVFPFVFRLVFPTRRELPAVHAAGVHQTAARLGFPPTSVLTLDTGHRGVTAAMVGPFRWPRYLVLTDGILSLLDPFALRGVVAHEIAHAKANHPALLMLVLIVIPALWITPAMTWIGELDPGAWLAVLPIAFVVGWLLLRALSHRFELEADQMSAEALGGADATILALRSVGQLSPQSIHRGGLRHPSEFVRIEHLLRCESHPAHRAAFHARGRLLRALLGVLLLGGAIASAVVQTEIWPRERVAWFLWTGRFEQARAAFTAMSATAIEGARAAHDWKRLAEDLAAAERLLPGGGDWRTVRDQLVRSGWRTGLEVLARDGAAAARPFLDFAMAGPTPSPIVRTVAALSIAAASEDEPRARALAAHARAIGAPTDVRAALDAAGY